MVLLMKALDYLHDDFIVLNGNMVFDFWILKKIMEHWGSAVAIDGNVYETPPGNPGVIISFFWGGITDIGRNIVSEESNGYAVGTCKFSPELTTEYQIEAERMRNVNRHAGYHEPLRAVLKLMMIRPVYTDNYKEWMWMKSQTYSGQKIF